MAGLEAWMICLVKLWLWGHDGNGSLNLPGQNMIMRTWQGWRLVLFALSNYDYENMPGLEAWICLVKIWLWGHDRVGSLYYLPCKNMIMRTWRGWKLVLFALLKYDYEDMTGLEAWIFPVKIWLIVHAGVGRINLPCQLMITRTWRGWKPKLFALSEYDSLIMRTWRGWKPKFALSEYDYEDMTGLEAWICLVKIWLWGHAGVGSMNLPCQLMITMTW